MLTPFNLLPALDKLQVEVVVVAALAKRNQRELLQEEVELSRSLMW